MLHLMLHLLVAADCSWEVVAYMKSLSADTVSKGQFWIPADEKGDSNQSFMITTIKSMRSSCLDMQLYVEHPLEEAPKEGKWNIGVECLLLVLSMLQF